MILVSFCDLPETMSRTELIRRGAPTALLPHRSVPDAIRLAARTKPGCTVQSPGPRGPWILQNCSGPVCQVDGDSETGTFCITDSRNPLEEVLLAQEIRYWLEAVDQKNIRRTLTRQLEELGMVPTGIPGLWQCDTASWARFVKEGSWVPAQIYAWDASPIQMRRT